MSALYIAIPAACILSLVYALVGLGLTNKFHSKFGFILACTFAGFWAMIPPEEKLKLGIDLSGGTILVYQAHTSDRDNTLRMDDLIAALKRRINASGVQDIPIRKIGSNRIEIIMAKAKDEDVAELKRRLTDVGALEFRILANRKHDSAAIDRALAPGGLTKPPSRYKWAKLGEVITGQNPRFTSTTITDPTRTWIPD